MADLQCLICEYAVEPEEDQDELLSLLGAQSAGSTEQLIRHMQGHDLGDWIKAFKMADRYIEQLETKLAECESRPMPAVMAPAALTGTSVDYAREQWPAAPAQPEEDLGHYFTPAEVERMRRQEKVRARIAQHDPDQTLIPRLTDAQRPEGVVGVKY